jgi:hypothetical protein
MAKNRILAKLVMVVEVLAAEHRSEYALAHQRPNPVLDKPRVTPIGEAAGKSPHQPKTRSNCPSSSAPAFDVIASYRRNCHHCTLFHRFKFEQLRGTFCLHPSSVVSIV